MSRLFKAGSDQGKKKTFLKILHNGASGSGKTTTASKASRPVVIEPSPQAASSIRAANPEALVFLVRKESDINEIVRALVHSSESEDGLGRVGKIDGEEFFFESIVLDDLEEVQDIIKKEILSKSSANKMTFQEWGDLGERLMNILRDLRNVECNFHCITKIVNAQDDEKIVHELALDGKKVKASIPGLFNLSGHHYRRNSDDGSTLEFVVGFRLPEKFISKAHPALKDMEEADPKVWLEKIREWDQGLDRVMEDVDHLLPEGAKPKTLKNLRRRETTNRPKVEAPPILPIQEQETTPAENKNEKAPQSTPKASSLAARLQRRSKIKMVSEEPQAIPEAQQKNPPSMEIPENDPPQWEGEPLSTLHLSRVKAMYDAPDFGELHQSYADIEDTDFEETPEEFFVWVEESFVWNLERIQRDEKKNPSAQPETKQEEAKPLQPEQTIQQNPEQPEKQEAEKPKLRRRIRRS